MTIPQTPTQVAQQLGYPSTLFGLTPEQPAYWHEPALPWLTEHLYYHPPLDRLGGALVWHYAEMSGSRMVPRFPKGCVVNVAPVYQRQNLVIGRVYLYRYTDPDTGQECWDMGRLVKIGGNVLWALADNEPGITLCWLLREQEEKAVWDVYEVTHYASYPALP